MHCMWQKCIKADHTAFSRPGRMHSSTCCRNIYIIFFFEFVPCIAASSNILCLMAKTAVCFAIQQQLCVLLQCVQNWCADGCMQGFFYVFFTEHLPTYLHCKVSYTFFLHLLFISSLISLNAMGWIGRAPAFSCPWEFLLSLGQSSNGRAPIVETLY